MVYIGWVPTVTGHLSFSAIGNAHHPSKCTSLRQKNAVCMMQFRDLLDVVLPYMDNNAVGRFCRETFANYIIGISGKFCFLADLREVVKEDCYAGTAYLVPLRDNQAKVRAWRKKMSSVPHHSEEYEEINSSLLGEVSGVAACKAEVLLSRNGKLEIKFAEFNRVEETADDQELLKRMVANQIFYFFKDVSHVHQHHDPKQDAITQVTKFNEAAPDEWISNTQHALYREVIRYKRFRTEKSLFRASGVLAYAKSFERSHASEASHPRKFNTDELQASLEVSREELRHNDQKKIAELDSIRTWFFALFGFVVSASFLVRSTPVSPTFEVHPILIKTTKFVAEEPVPVFFILVVLSFVTSFFSHRRDPASIQFVRTVLRWMQGFRMRWYMLANAMIASICAFIFYALLLKQLL